MRRRERADMHRVWRRCCSQSVLRRSMSLQEVINMGWVAGRRINCLELGTGIDCRVANQVVQVTGFLRSRRVAAFLPAVGRVGWGGRRRFGVVRPFAGRGHGD